MIMSMKQTLLAKTTTWTRLGTMTIMVRGVGKGLRIDIPEFHGSLQLEEFLDWLNSVEEVLEFKDVHENIKVSLIATRFRGCASAWWQQFKATRLREGKEKIETWEKLRKHMRSTFLPPNYSKLVYQQLQNLRQGNHTVGEYTTEFYELVARSDLAETDEQLESRYIGGMRVQFQDTLNLFDPFSVAKAQQRALQLEKHMSRKANSGGAWSGNSPNNRGGGSNSAPFRASTPLVQNPKSFVSDPLGKAQTVGPKRTAFRCFKCGETGHCMAECKKSDRVGKGLFIEHDENQLQEYHDFEHGPVYDNEPNDVVEEYMTEDDGPLLMVRKTCFTPRETEGSDGWLRNNVFQSICTIGGKVCKLVIDPGSCENIISKEAIRKLGLETQPHPHPYKLSWLQKGTEVNGVKKALVPFSIGKLQR
ncbi:uncharacterized protein LOC18777367 [Prunus persica]|uniref:uncharacterized protein LOC18777367 n=1 Tax=Prunus persica TaxID=3760 RepID=UPI0009AB5BF7|nr:uncharacterized protein LOC18777367 [Prunus persica]